MLLKLRTAGPSGFKSGQRPTATIGILLAADDAAALKVAETLQEADDAMAAEYAYEESDMDRSGVRQNLDKYAPKYVKALVRVEKDREIPIRAPGTKEATE